MAERDSGQPGSAEAAGPPGREVGATSFLQRAVIRRRVRFLHRRRELALYDLGGFLFESHRLGQPHEDILAEKLEALTVLDDELALLQRALELHEEVAVLSEPGIAACSHCGTLRDSAANFCPGCGRPAGETLPLATAPAATAAGESGAAVAATPDATAEMPSADLSAGHDTEIAAATAVAWPPAPPRPDATAEIPAVQPPAESESNTDRATEPAEDPDTATWQPPQPTEDPDTATWQPPEPAEEADTATWQPPDPAVEADLATPVPLEPAEDPDTATWQSPESAEEDDLRTPELPQPTHDVGPGIWPGHEPQDGGGSDERTDETSTAAADSPS